MKYRRNNIIENSSSEDNSDESFKDNLENHNNTEYSVGGQETIDKDHDSDKSLVGNKKEEKRKK